MIPSSDHNEALSGDTLYSAFLNHEWREIVVAAVIEKMTYLASTITDETDLQEFEVRYGALIDDFYNEDVMDFTPVGTIVAYPSIDIPLKWEVCAGAFLPQSSYPELFALIGTKYGTGGLDFRLPDLRERFILGHRNDGGGTVIDETGGETEHVLTTTEIPAHSHTQRGRNSSGGANLQTALATGADATQLTAFTSTANAGGGAAHNNMPPYHSLIYIIKVLP